MAQEDAQETPENMEDPSPQSAEAEIFSELDIQEEDWESEATDSEGSDRPDEENQEEAAENEGAADRTTLTAEQINTLSSMGFDENDISSLKGSPLLDKIMEFGKNEPSNKDNTTLSGDEVPGSPDEKPASGFEIALDDDVYDPDLIDQFKSMRDHYDRKIAELNTVIHSLGDEAYVSRLDRMFDSSGMEKFFGKGSTNDLAPDSEQAANRNLVQEELVALSAGYEATGKNTPDFTEMFQRAIRSALGQEMESSARHEFVEKVESRHKQRIARPSNRASRSKGSVHQAVSNVAQLMRDRGMMDDNMDSFE